MVASLFEDGHGGWVVRSYVLVWSDQVRN